MGLPKNLKIEEIPAAAKFIYNSMVRDWDDFTAFSTEVFTTAFKTGYLAKVTEVENLPAILNYQAQSNRITSDLYTNVDLLRPAINKLEGYVYLSRKSLTIAMNKFGIKELRKEIRKHNVEGVAKNLTIVMKNVSDNSMVLGSKGLKPLLVTKITDARTAIITLNEQQQLKRTEMLEGLKDNWAEIEELWEIASDVLATGKAMYRVENKTRAKDYSIAQLKKRLNQEGRGEEGEAETEKEMGILEIRATDKSNDKVLEGLGLEIMESGDVITTDEDGEGNLELEVGTYTGKAKMEGFVELNLSNIVIKADHTTELAIEMEPLPPAE